MNSFKTRFQDFFLISRFPFLFIFYWTPNLSVLPLTQSNTLEWIQSIHPIPVRRFSSQCLYLLPPHAACRWTPHASSAARPSPHRLLLAATSILCTPTAAPTLCCIGRPPPDRTAPRSPTTRPPCAVLHWPPAGTAPHPALAGHPPRRRPEPRRAPARCCASRSRATAGRRRRSHRAAATSTQSSARRCARAPAIYSWARGSCTLRSLTCFCSWQGAGGHHAAHRRRWRRRHEL